MPQVFRVGGYLVYFWINESLPLEPVHVHVAKGKPTPNATKIWLTKSGNVLLDKNRSYIPFGQLSIIMRIIEARHKEIEQLWISKFGQISYYC